MSRGRRLAATGVVATIAAAALNALLATVARSAGVDFQVTDGEVVPVSGIAFVTGAFSLVGLLGAAALLRWSGDPVRWWLRTTVALTTLSLVPPFLAAADTSTALTLAVLHLVAAAVVIPAVARVLPQEAVLPSRSLPVG
jgi:hypothetical protein